MFTILFSVFLLKKWDYDSEVKFMKKNTLFFLPVFFLLLASCNAGNNSGGEERQPLGKPVISVNANKDGLYDQEKKNNSNMFINNFSELLEALK